MKLKNTFSQRYSSWLKNTSKLLAIGILLNNIPINSFAGILSDDTRYETFTGNNISINDILEEDKVDVEIEGNTLINLVKFPKTEINYNEALDYQELNIEENQLYTIVIDIFENTLDNGLWFSAYEFGGKLDSGACTEDKPYCFLDNSIKQDTKLASNGQTGRFILKCGFKKIGPLNKSRFVLFSKDSSSGKCTASAMIFEGDLDESELPLEYSEGIISAGENNIPENSIKISSCKGRPNLIRNSGFLNGFSNYSINREAQLTIEKDSSAKSGNIIKIEVGDSTNSGIWQRINIQNILNKKYTLSGWIKGDVNSDINICLEKHIHKKITLETDSWIKFEVTSDIHPTNWNRVITFYSQTPNITFYLKDIKLEESDTATPYIPHEDESNYDMFDYVSKNTINLSEPLRSLPNGVKDRIIKKDGKWYIERNCAEYTITGEEKIGIDPNAIEGLTKFVIGENISNSNTLICDSLLYGYGKDRPYNIRMGGGNENTPFYAIYLTMPDTYTINEVRQFLIEKKPTIVYQPFTPIYEPINIDLSVQLFKETTYISNNSNIPASMTVTVDRVLNRATEYTKLAKINPTIENVSQARMWINMIDDSSKKDQLQNEINNIVDISDLEIEKKSATANVDIYIKSKNTLSMSLNTNSITFDNFSGIEDMEKLGEVEITVSSTLPYSLNAYLESEIYNSDKSNIMDKSILNIKESSESTYQAFKNTIDKIILKENCAEGNFISHNIDLKLAGNIVHEKDTYKTTIKFEAEQK